MPSTVATPRNRAGHRTIAMRTFLLLAALMLGLTTPAPGADPLVVGVDTDSRPFASLERTSFSGFDVELIRALGQAMDADVGITAVPRKDFQAALASGRIDAALSGMQLPARPDPALAYSVAYLTGGQRILVLATTGDIAEARDLDGLLVGARLGSPALDVLYEHAPLAMPSLFPRIEDAYAELLRGDLDAVLQDALTADGYALAFCGGKAKTVGPEYDSRPFVILLRADSPWKARLDKAIAALREDGTIETLRKKWFEAPTAPQAAPSD